MFSFFPQCCEWYLTRFVFDREKHNHPLHHHHTESPDDWSAVLWHTRLWVREVLHHHHHHHTLCHQTTTATTTMMMFVFVFVGRESTVTSSPSVNTSHPTCPSPSRSRESRTHFSQRRLGVGIFHGFKCKLKVFFYWERLSSPHLSFFIHKGALYWALAVVSVMYSNVVCCVVCVSSTDELLVMYLCSYDEREQCYSVLEHSGLKSNTALNTQVRSQHHLRALTAHRSRVLEHMKNDVFWFL